MSFDFVLNAEPRTDTGKGASRRLRREDKVPAILYGGDQPPRPLSLLHKEVLKAMEHEAFYSHVLILRVDGGEDRVVLKDLQRHPVKPRVLHLDLQRVTDTTRVRMHVPLHFVGEDQAPGVRQSGGVVNHLMTHVDVVCLAKDLPEFIEVDCSRLKAGESIHLSDLALPPGVGIPELAQGPEHDLPVVSIVLPRGATEAAAEAEEGGEEGAG